MKIKCEFCDKEYNHQYIGLHYKKEHNIDYKELQKSKIDTKNFEYKCEICGEKFEYIRGLVSHIKHKHNITDKEYYNLYLKKDKNEGKCVRCGKETRFYGIKQGYCKYCGSTCINLDRDYSTMSETWAKKTKEELEERKKHYREIWDSKSKKEIKQIVKQRKNTKKERHGDENWTNPDKIVETIIKNHGDDYYSNLSKYIWDNMTPQKLRKRKIKTIKTCKKKYNRPYPYNHEKSKQTKKERHGDENYVNIEGIKQHFTDKYGEGITNPSQVPEIHKKMTAKYKAPNGKTYDSSWEYKFEQYLIEHNIEYEYHPNITLKWMDINGKNHIYHPDFKIIRETGEEIIEIKGDYFFNESGEFYNPYNKTEEGYANAEKKWKCMMENHVKVYTSKELKELGIKID